MSDSEASSGGIKSDRTVFRIMETIRDEGSATLTEIAAGMDVAKSTVHRHLTTLDDLGYVIRDGNEYRLGFRFLDLGIQVRDRREEYRQMKTTARDLADETGELVSFVVEENGAGVFLYRERGDRGVESAAHIGKRVSLHSIAAGKALLASLPEARIEEIIEADGLSAETEKTVTNRETLMADLEQIADEGVAHSVGEHTVGLASVGAPVVSPEGEVIGGLSVAGPTHRMEDDRFYEEIPHQLLSRINEFELNITYS
jgi:DNA-binding IclR family transcriptional regulator